MDIEGAEEVYFFSYAQIFATAASFWLFFGLGLPEGCAFERLGFKILGLDLGFEG